MDKDIEGKGKTGVDGWEMTMRVEWAMKTHELIDQRDNLLCLWSVWFFDLSNFE